MEKKKKIILIISVIVIIISIIMSILLLTSKDKEEPFTIDGIDLVENKDILKDKEVNNLNITDVSLLTRDGISTYRAMVSNNTNVDIKINKLYVKFYLDSEEIEIVVLNNTTLKSNGSTYISVTSETDLSKVKRIEYVME
ncbi:MAG: hypothetical protein IJE89_05690 [Bacilli bacterium]|nr:hypothetical protein [Bacilli bacterium]